MTNQILQPPPVQPLIISTDIISLQGVATSALVANVVYLLAFELNAPTTFTGGMWRVGGPTPAGTTDIGIYTFAGALLTHTGAITNVVSTTMTNAFSGGNILLPPGRYFMAMTESNSADLIFSEAIGNLAQISHYRQGVTAATSGVLPNTTGGYTDVPARFPAFAITPLNGLT